MLKKCTSWNLRDPQSCSCKVNVRCFCFFTIMLNWPLMYLIFFCVWEIKHCPGDLYKIIYCCLFFLVGSTLQTGTIFMSQIYFITSPLGLSNIQQLTTVAARICFRGHFTYLPIKYICLWGHFTYLPIKVVHIYFHIFYIHAYLI